MILLPYPPSVNRYWRNFRGRMVVSAEGRAYKQHAALACLAAGLKPLAGGVELHAVLHPKLTKKMEASLVLIDLDNMLKVCCDSLNGIGYADDSQIRRIVAEVGEPVDGGGMSVNIVKL